VQKVVLLSCRQPLVKSFSLPISLQTDGKSALGENPFYSNVSQIPHRKIGVIDISVYQPGLHPARLVVAGPGHFPSGPSEELRLSCASCVVVPVEGKKSPHFRPSSIDDD
jgi:hypothetical protein